MSQQVRITRTKVKGAAPFLGFDGEERLYSSDPEVVGKWLCDADRTRFNQHRSKRCKYDEDKNLVPIGEAVTDISDREAREKMSYLAAVPTYVLSSSWQRENTEWFAAIKRREALKSQGLDPGAMPRFRSRKHSDDQFVCWFNGGRNARFEKTNRSHGVVTISGQNPSRFRQEGHPAKWQFQISVKLSQTIRDYTSVIVNLTKKTLTFVNQPLPIKKDEAAPGGSVGVDLGVVHNLTDSTGTFYDLPRSHLKELDRQVKEHQRAMARAVKASGRADQGEYKKHGASNRFLQHEQAVTRLRGKQKRITVDLQQKFSTELVRGYDFIGMEDLAAKFMMRRPKPKPDPDNPGKFLPNGAVAKAGLNRALASSGFGRIRQFLEYKTSLAGSVLLMVPAFYTSQTCNQCGHKAKKNRESQAVFHCQNCDHTCNADVNAARNIRDLALKQARTRTKTDGAGSPKARSLNKPSR